MKGISLGRLVHIGGESQGVQGEESYRITKAIIAEFQKAVAPSNYVSCGWPEGGYPSDKLLGSYQKFHWEEPEGQDPQGGRALTRIAAQFGGSDRGTDEINAPLILAQKCAVR